jgi:hypothetical protein
MRTKSIHALIDDAAIKSKQIATRAVQKANEVFGTAGDVGKGAAARITGAFKKGEHRVQETVEKAAHDVEEVAVNEAHSAEEVAQRVSDGVKEVATRAKHRGRELADQASRKLKPR